LLCRRRRNTLSVSPQQLIWDECNKTLIICLPCGCHGCLPINTKSTHSTTQRKAPQRHSSFARLVDCVARKQINQRRRCVARLACTRENRRDFVIVLCASAAVTAAQWYYVIIDPAHPATRRRRRLAAAPSPPPPPLLPYRGRR